MKWLMVFCAGGYFLVALAMALHGLYGEAFMRFVVGWLSLWVAYLLHNWQPKRWRR